MSSNRILKAAIGCALAGVASIGVAQEATNTVTELETVIVTGTFIRGTAEDAALPVDVISTEELERQGAPSAVDMLKSLTMVNGTIAESNRFTSGRGQASQGSASINLRGFGDARTLTLLNGKRLATGDANLLPANAISRIEILTSGGASTYGSDAIAGVVNFITKEGIEGLELSADYRYIDGSDGDYNAGITWGRAGDASDLFLAFNYFHRSKLAASERDWAHRSYWENPQGGWSTGSNPGSFLFRGPLSGTAPFGMLDQRADPGCEFFGGVLLNDAVPSIPGVGNGTGDQCQTQFTQWDYLVEEQNSYQGFASFKLDIADTMELKLEALYAFTDVPEAGATPSGTTTRPITATVLPAGTFGQSVTALQNPGRTSFFYIPLTNPGFSGIFAPGAVGGPVPADATAGYIQINQWRPFLATGNPGTASGMQRYAFERDSARLSAQLSGEFLDVSWNTSLTYGAASTKRLESDISTARLQLALRGLGGENCNGIVAGQVGSTCEWFNPFSTALPTTRGGVSNPYFTGATNSAGLVHWLEDEMEANTDVRVGEYNLVFSGELPFLSLPGGQIGWAAGGQYRHAWIRTSYGDSSNRALNPCVDTPVNGTTTCLPYGESPYNFLSTYNEIDVDRGVYAAFTEFNVPLLDSLNAQVAARYEDYGNKGGSSFDPKLSLRWQVIDQLAFRGSVGTTFRAPPQTSLIPDENIAFTSILGSNRPVGTVGNPDLKPEESFQWSVGAIVTLGNFRALVDFWRYDIDKLLTVEPTSGILNVVFPNGAGGADNCATVDPAFLASRFTFSAGCSAATLLKVTRNSINGAGLRNDGIDFSLDYTFDDVLGGTIVLGGAGTWIQTYKTETLVINGVVFEQGFDGVGYLNQGTTLFALPEWRAQAYVDYNYDRHNLRWTAHYVDAYRDQRDGITRDGRTDASIFTAASPDGRVIGSSVVHNLTYRVELETNTTLLMTIENIADKDPQFTRLELNYDPLTAQYPLGRTIKVGVRQKF